MKPLFFSVTQISFPVSDISIFNIQDIQYCFNLFIFMISSFLFFGKRSNREILIKLSSVRSS